MIQLKRLRQLKKSTFENIISSAKDPSVALGTRWSYTYIQRCLAYHYKNSLSKLYEPTQVIHTAFLFGTNRSHQLTCCISHASIFVSWSFRAFSFSSVRRILIQWWTWPPKCNQQRILTANLTWQREYHQATSPFHRMEYFMTDLEHLNAVECITSIKNWESQS